jgi:ubiquinone/menaquinone biosynthesis C-methylase UbiE
MSVPLLLLTTGIVVVALLGIVWWILVRRIGLPCPPSFTWLLENRIMENLAGGTAIIERAAIRKGMQVLDAGCGPGRLTIPVAEYIGSEGHVVALDLQPEMLARVGRRVAQRGLTNVTTVRAALGEGRLRHAGFDRALLVTVLGEIPDRLGALQEIHAALKPGGLLSVTEILPDPHFQSRGTVRKLAQQAGFVIDDVHSTWGSFTFNLIRPTDP